jgi:chorismate synthase
MTTAVVATKSIFKGGAFVRSGTVLQVEDDELSQLLASGFRRVDGNGSIIESEPEVDTAESTSGSAKTFPEGDPLAAVVLNVGGADKILSGVSEDAPVMQHSKRQGRKR